MSMASIARGPETPVLDITIGDMISGMAGCFPDRDAVISRHQNVYLSWREFDQEVDRTARGLAALGLQPFDRIGVWSANCVEWIVLQMACAKAGFVFAGLSPRYRAEELAFVLKKSGMKALFLWDHDASCDYARVLYDARRGQDLALKHVVWMGTNSWMNMLTNGRGLPEYEPQAADAVGIQYTANFGGTPKEVLLTHHNLLNQAWAGSDWLGITERDRVCNPCSLSHCSGSTINGLAAFIRGASVILPSPEFDAQAVLEAIEDEQATVIGGAAEMYRSLLDHPDFSRFDTRSLRAAWMGSAPCPSELLRRVKEKMAIERLAVIYGRTGAPWIAMSADSEDACRVMPNTEVRIVSPGTSDVVPIGTPGELCVRGPFVAHGNDSDMEAMSRAINSEGWLHTGDLAVLHPSGCVSLLASAKDSRAKAAVREERYSLPATIAR